MGKKKHDDETERIAYEKGLREYENMSAQEKAKARMSWAPVAVRGICARCVHRIEHSLLYLKNDFEPNYKKIYSCDKFPDGVPLEHKKNGCKEFIERTHEQDLDYLERIRQIYADNGESFLDF